MAFQKATKKQSKLRLNLNGPAGAGKTYSALAIAAGLGSKIAVIDTERGSASKYADKFGFDVMELFDNYHPKRLESALDEANGYDVVVVDSLSHFWNGKGGMLELVDQEVEAMKQRGNKPDNYAAWKKITPIYNSLVQKLLSTNAHLICTARAKMDYDKQSDGGKTKIVKLGLAPELRDGWQYEFDVEGMMTEDNVLIVGKTRCSPLKGKMFKEPGADVAKILKAWLEDGEAAAVVLPAPPPVMMPANDNGDDKVARCITQIGLAKDLTELEAIGVRIAKTPQSFQVAVEDVYAEREHALRTAA